MSSTSSPTSPLKALETHLSTLIPTPNNSTPPNGSIPGAVLLAISTSTSSTTPNPNPSRPTQPTNTTTTYTHSTGTTSLLPSESRPLTPFSLFWIASCTKLLTSLAACQLVHRGLWSWSRPITDIIPELRSLKVLKGWSSSTNEPIFGDDVAATSSPGPAAVAADKITLAHLLTHTSGLAYDFLSPDLLKYQAWQAATAAAAAATQSQSQSSTTSTPPPATPPKRGAILSTYLLPLLSAPGTTWAYGPSIDFAGLLVERLTGMRLGEYVWENVLRPVGVRKGEVVWRASDLTKDPEGGLREEQVREKWVYLSMRNPDGGGGMVSVPGGIGGGMMDDAVDDLGGGGVRAAPEAYVRVLASLGRGDGRILPAEWVGRWGLRPWLVDDESDGEGKLGRGLGKELERVFGEMEGGRMLTGGLPLPVKGGGGDWDGGEWEYNHSLLGCLARRRGTGDGDWALHWGGLPNLFWFVDPKEEVAGLLSMQLLPPADPVCLDLAVEFREAVVKEMGKSGNKEEKGEVSARAKI